MYIRLINTVQQQKGDGRISLIHLAYIMLERLSLPEAVSVCSFGDSGCKIKPRTVLMVVPFYIWMKLNLCLKEIKLGSPIF